MHVFRDVLLFRLIFNKFTQMACMAVSLFKWIKYDIE